MPDPRKQPCKFDDQSKKNFATIPSGGLRASTLYRLARIIPGFALFASRTQHLLFVLHQPDTCRSKPQYDVFSTSNYYNIWEQSLRLSKRLISGALVFTYVKIGPNGGSPTAVAATTRLSQQRRKKASHLISSACQIPATHIRISELISELSLSLKVMQCNFRRAVETYGDNARSDADRRVAEHVVIFPRP
jgi:hypothetical protein